MFISFPVFHGLFLLFLLMIFSELFETAEFLPGWHCLGGHRAHHCRLGELYILLTKCQSLRVSML